MAATNGSTVDAFAYQDFIRAELNWVTFTKLVVIIVLTVLFVYVNFVILYALSSKHVFKESSRYILFAHMLFNDSVHLLLTFVLFFLALMFLKLGKAGCSLILFLDATTFYNAPLNLAVMSLERYVAICFPLKHAEIATQKRTFIAISFIWLFGSMNILINIITSAVVDPNFFYVQMFCSFEQIFMQPWQPDLFSGFNVILFVSVTLIIVFTYISIMITARSVSSNKDSAKKAHKTVLLHLIQLGLCTTSFLYSTIERALYIVTDSGTSIFLHLRYLNFLFLLILPRCLSPVIYGLRDDSVRPLFKNHFFHCSGKFHTAVNVQ
ncbi:odorant receptor 131-2-like [Salminus brasiliensis]|uniref:odorant receptor 131-2-like n=1 Tax=Salminus brasiliensis TaxID=930266 RepID=UPI003B832A2F